MVMRMLGTALAWFGGRALEKAADKTADTALGPIVERVQKAVAPPPYRARLVSRADPARGGFAQDVLEIIANGKGLDELARVEWGKEPPIDIDALHRVVGPALRLRFTVGTAAPTCKVTLLDGRSWTLTVERWPDGASDSKEAR
jgi:hypothetical protein